MKSFRKFFRIISLILMLVIIAVAGYNIALKYMYPQKNVDLVEKYSREYGVAPELVFAVIKCESSFKADAVSSAGAVGLMQLTEETFDDVKKMVGDDDTLSFETHATDPEVNVKYGTRYLKFLFDFFKGDKIAVLAAYNAGMGNVKEWMGNSPTLEIKEIEFKETKEYVNKVLVAESYYK